MIDRSLSAQTKRASVPCDDVAKERATEMLAVIWPEHFKDITTAAGLLWAQLVVEAVVGAMETSE
jgi:hypothetical protein